MLCAGASKALAALLGLLLIRNAVSQKFTAAEVKPHFQCTSEDGQQRVRDYVHGLTQQRAGIIALIQYTFTLPQPTGYTAFGASCVLKHPDPVVVLVDDQVFTVAAGLGATTVGDYSQMPFLTTGTPPQNGSMCVSDPKAYGERGYAGARLLHKASGQEFCVVAGTFPHCYGAWLSQFLSDIQGGCAGRPLLIIADTNAACELEGPQASRHTTLEDIARNHSAKWGTCSDPAVAEAEPTCCHDLAQGHPEARYWYDRTALCGGGVVQNFQVHPSFVCDTNEEHKFTTAAVELHNSTARTTAVVI